ncbi:MAG: fructosamine kinase family protein [Myxococcota bacterium]|nr:fructosamine kinase family protein [Myxococcota bacterium]MDW8362214.1 fructosamine kinase family protein [Myxococcales bacterium]
MGGVDDDLRASLETLLDEPVARLQPVRGGDVHRAFRVETRGRERWFAKHSPSAPRDLFEAEARGLHWLATAGALRIPAVRACGQGWLVLEWIEPGAPSPTFDVELGEGLAALHRAGAPCIGLDHDNYIGTLPQANASIANWPAFWRERRLLPQIDRAASRLPRELRAELERLAQCLESLLPDEAPARLHGDLWAGNCIVAANGKAVLVDPAVYGGAREVDLAMMELFGGFGPRVFEAYEAAWPTARTDRRLRRAIYQLYYLLVHVNLFGSGWIPALARTLRVATDRG